MSWQNYHENIMTAIDNSGISSVGTALGSVLSGVTSASGTDRLGLVTAAFAALNGATTITSVVSGKYGEYEKGGRIAQMYYSIDAYTAIGYSLTCFCLVGGMGYLEAMSYGSLPVLLFLIRLLLTKRMRHYPNRVGYLLLWINTLPLFLCYAFLLLGRSDLCQTIVRITTSLGIIKSMHYIAFPESKGSALKYTWCPKTEVWVNADLIFDKHKEATIASLTDYGHTRLILNALVLPQAFGVGSMKAIGISAIVHAACLLHDLVSPKIKSKVYALPREIYLAIALFVGWNLFLVDLF